MSADDCATCGGTGFIADDRDPDLRQLCPRCGGSGHADDHRSIYDPVPIEEPPQ